MANPTPAAVTAIRSWVSDWVPTDAEIRDAQNAVLVANPVTEAPQVPQSMNMGRMMTLLDAAARVAVSRVSGFDRAAAAVAAGDTVGVLHWLQLLEDWLSTGQVAGITVEQINLLRADVQAQVADPTWLAQLPRPLVELGRLLDTDDIAAARAAGGN